MNRKELKTKARELIKGKILVLLAIYLVAGVVISAISYITWGAGAIIVAGGFMLSMSAIFLSIVNKNKKPEVENLLYGYKEGNFTRGLLGYIRYEIFIFLWTLLFIVPGIIKSFAYSQMFFLMADHPKMEAGVAQKKSIEMMDGHKGELFTLYLSFIPWFLLVCITFGVATIYVAPYVQATLAQYYNYLKKVTK